MGCDNVTTARAFATYLQDQYLASLPHETCGFRSIIRNTTDWPSWERFSSIINFVPNGDESLTSAVPDPDTNKAEPWIRREKYIERSHDKSDIWIMCKPHSIADGRVLEITMRYSDHVFERAIIETLANGLLQAISRITLEPNKELSVDNLRKSLGLSLPAARPVFSVKAPAVQCTWKLSLIHI